MRRLAKKSIAFLLSAVLVLGAMGDSLLLVANAALDPTAKRDTLAMSGKISEKITVDGVLDEAVWAKQDSYDVSYLADFTISNNTSSFATAWDDDNFYIAMTVEDKDVITTYTDPEIYNNDGVEFFIDADYSRGGGYDKVNDYHIFIRYDGELLVWGGNGGTWSSPTPDLEIEHVIKLTDKGFDVEAAIPWTAFGVEPKDGHLIGFGVNNNDNDSATGNARKEIMWLEGQNSGKPATWGTLYLYETRKPLVAAEAVTEPVVKSGNKNDFVKEMWNFTDECSLAFPGEGLEGTTVKFATLCDSEFFYLAMLAEGVTADEVCSPFVEIVLNGSNTKSGAIVADENGYILQFYPKAPGGDWARTNIGKGNKDGVSKAVFNLGDGAYAGIFRISWDNLIPDKEDKDHSLMSFSFVAGSSKPNPDNADMGVLDDSKAMTTWTGSDWNAWGGSALDNAGTIIISNPNTIPIGNNAPTGSPYYAYSIQAGGTVSGKIKVTDPDGEKLTFTLDKEFDAAKGTVTLNAETGEWTYTAPAGLLTGTNPGVSFVIVATDSNEKAPMSFKTRVEVKAEHAPTNLTYYVNGDTGNDSNDGLSEGTALATIQAASDKTNPGDTVIIHESKVPYGWRSDEYYKEHPGQYAIDRDGLVIIERSGLPGAPITYKAAEGEAPVLKGNGTYNNFIVAANYIVVDGLTVRGMCDEISYDEAWNQFWAKIAPDDDGYNAGWNTQEVGAVNSNGIDVGPTSAHTIKNNEGGILSENVTVVHHVTIRNCVAEYLGGSGIGGSKCDYVTFENCEARNNCWWGVWGNSGFGFIETVDIDDNITDYKLIIRNSISAGNRHFIPWKANSVRLSDGNGIIMDTCDEHENNYLGKTLISNNLVYENGGSGIHVFRCNNVDIVNNTIFNNGSTPELSWSEVFSNDARNANIFNNLVYSRTGNKEDPAQGASNSKLTAYDYNLFYNYADGSKVGTAQTGVTVGEHNLYDVNPMFAGLTAHVHIPEGFDPDTYYPANWYETKTAREGIAPGTWKKAANAAGAGFYHDGSTPISDMYDVTTYGYDFVLSANSPAKGSASDQWQAKAGGAAYANTIGIFSEVGAGVKVASYADVARDAWYYDAVNYVTAHNIMGGVGNNRFSPNANTTRGQLVTMLYRMEGNPAVTTSSFSDVPAGKYYTDAVAWASANKIVEGVGNNLFEPEKEIKREDVAVILYRYAKFMGYDVTAVGDLSVYPDSGKVSSYAKDAMTWAVGVKLINGSAGKLIPGDFTDRAQIAQLFMNFCEKVA